MVGSYKLPGDSLLNVCVYLKLAFFYRSMQRSVWLTLLYVYVWRQLKLLSSTKKRTSELAFLCLCRFSSPFFSVNSNFNSVGF